MFDLNNTEYSQAIVAWWLVWLSVLTIVLAHMDSITSIPASDMAVFASHDFTCWNPAKAGLCALDSES